MGRQRVNYLFYVEANEMGDDGTVTSASEEEKMFHE